MSLFKNMKTWCRRVLNSVLSRLGFSVPKSNAHFTKIQTLINGFLKIEEWNGGLSFPIVVVRASDSVVGMLYDATNDRILLVRQYRAPMVREDNPDGAITELVAGRFDVNLGPKALLVKEAEEEAGVKITEDEVELINLGVPMSLSAGVLTERCYGGFAVIHPDRIAEGDEGYGVDEGEQISRIWMSAEKFISPTTVHDCWRVYAMAQLLARRRLEEEIHQLRIGRIVRAATPVPNCS